MVIVIDLRQHYLLALSPFFLELDFRIQNDLLQQVISFAFYLSLGEISNFNY